MRESESVKEKYGFIWYSDYEIFDYDDSQLDQIAKKHYDLGYTILITFSGTHFRWSFYPWWDKITDYLSRFVSACHKYGIKVVEHHSCHLNSGDPLIDGVPISSMRTINGATGKPLLTVYMAYGLCYNNPDYRRIYFN